MKFSRGLAALLLTIFFQTTLSAEYLYKDEVIHNPKFRADVNSLGSELYEKTGISLKMVIIKELKSGQQINEYEKDLIKEFKEPTILLTFSEKDTKVDILANDISLYKYFDKKQVLSPSVSPVQSLFIALFYSDSIKGFIEGVGNYGGTIIPLLATKSKEGELIGKYSAALYNGYGDIADQIAESKDVVLKNSLGNSNKNTLLVIRLLFYGVIFYAIFAYIRRVLYRRRHKDE